VPLRFPAEFIGGFADMRSLFRAICERQRLPNGYTERMFGLVPEVIRDLPCFLDLMTGLWRYDYGDPLTLAAGNIIGTHMFHDVERLFEIICCASWRLPPRKRDAYLERLSDRNHHEDVLVEFAPILRLGARILVEHEQRGLAAGNRTIDWQIQAPDQPVLLLEVKNRMRDLVDSFEAIKNKSSDLPIPEPQHDHSMLFKSILGKFRVRQATEAIQAVWIKTGLKQEETKLQAAFGELDPERLHVAILGNWDSEAYLLGSDTDTKRRVRKVLGLKQTSRLVFKRSDHRN
jgi:hypothetical protein